MDEDRNHHLAQPVGDVRLIDDQVLGLAELRKIARPRVVEPVGTQDHDHDQQDQHAFDEGHDRPKDVIYDGVRRVQIYAVIEGLDGSGQDDREHHEDDRECERSVIAQVELPPVGVEEVAERVLQVRGKQEGDQDRGDVQNTPDRTLDDANNDEEGKPEQDCQIDDRCALDRANEVHAGSPKAV